MSVLSQMIISTEKANEKLREMIEQSAPNKQQQQNFCQGQCLFAYRAIENSAAIISNHHNNFINYP